MSINFGKIMDTLGLDTRADEFTYGKDDRFGILSNAKIPEKWVKTTCGYCSVGCGMEIGVKDGKAITVKGDPDHPVNDGKLCPKGLAEHYIIDAEGRAKYPLIRGWAGFNKASWDDALDTFVTKVKDVQERYGPSGFAVLSTGQLVLEEFYALGKLVQLGFSTNNYDGNTTLCMASAVAGYKRSFGSDGPPGSYEDLEKAETVFLIGANIADNHPILAYRLFKNTSQNPNTKVIVVDPRATKTAMMADVFLPIKPRTDVYLLNGLAHLMIAEGWVDEEFVRKHTTGYDELKEHLERYTLPHVAKVTKLTEGKIYETARAIGTSKSTFFAWTMGVNHSTQGTETVNAINNLALLTGNIGREGASPFSITGQCNAMGSREASFTSSAPGYRKFESKDHRKELAAMWNIAEEELPIKRGLAYPDIIKGIIDGEIKALWIIATNPLVSYPDQARLKEALSKLEFLCVQDCYHPTPTSEIAHLVLPAAMWGEKEGSYTNSERRCSKANKAVEPPGSAKSDFDICLALAEKLRIREKLYPGWTTPEDAFNEWRQVSKGRLCDYSGMSYERLAEGPIQWPSTEEDPYGGDRLYKDGKFQTENARAKFFCIRNELPPEEPDSEYPFLLNTGRTVEHWHTRTKTGKVAILEKSQPEAWIEINPKDAKKLGVQNHDRVKVQSRRGQVDGLRVRATSIVAPGQVFVPFHFFETNVNNLTLDDACPISREPNFKQCAVRIER
ncbi:MAG: nitrate reductase [Planctomycetota bacterium]|nr:nitrate reductase [Planctomycetota bacterium]